MAGKERMPTSRIGSWTKSKTGEGTGARDALARLHEHGFTLIEIIMTLALLGLVFALVLPQTGAGNPLPSFSRQLIGAMQSLFTAASSSKILYRLYFDLDQRSYWAMRATTDGDRLPADPSLAYRGALPSKARFVDIRTAQHGKVTAGKVFVQFFPGGRAEQAVIHLSDQSEQVMTLILNPLTGAVQVMEEYREPPVPAIPDAYLSFFQRLPPPPVLPFGGAFRP